MNNTHTVPFLQCGLGLGVASTSLDSFYKQLKYRIKYSWNVPKLNYNDNMHSRDYSCMADSL